jgi:hypothetical protein
MTTTIAPAVRPKEPPMNEQHINLDDSVLAPKGPLGGSIADTEGHIFLDTEGHVHGLDTEVDDADAEGHIKLDADEQIKLDAEGHIFLDTQVDDADDTEGHYRY